jgi:DnaJ-domain-containing protein 1
MFGSHKIKVDPKLLERAQRCAETGGYATVEEFITHAIERACAALEDAGDDQELKRRLKGLGYLS